MTSPLLPLEGQPPPEFGLSAFDSRPLFPSQAWLDGQGADTWAWTDVWVTNHVAQAVIGAVLVIGFWLWVSRDMTVVPGRRQYLGETVYNLLRNTIARDILGHEYRRFLPFLVTIFSFILVNNMFGQLFLFMFPTFSKIGFTYALAVISWLVYNGAGIHKHGFVGYLKHTLIPPGVPKLLWVLIIPLEFLSNIVTRPLTLALRLFANLFAGHLVIMVFVVGGGWLLTQPSLVYRAAGGISLVFSFMIFALEIFVGCLQAYIFTVLSAQYVSSAVADEH